MKRSLLVLALLTGCEEDEAPVSREEVDLLVEEVLLEGEPEPGLSDEEIDALVDDLLMEEEP